MFVTEIPGVEVAPCLLPKISGVEVSPSVTSVESSEQFWRIWEPVTQSHLELIWIPSSMMFAVIH